jgi:hypothetical protein
LPQFFSVVFTLSSTELLDLIEQKGREVVEALAVLRSNGT